MTESSASVTADSLQYLRATKPWVRLISVMLWIATAFTVLGALAFMFGGPAVRQGFNGAEQMVGVIGVFYGAIALVYGFLALFLGRYASGIGNLIVEPSSPNLEYALKAQKSFWTLSGVLTLIALILTVLGIVAAILVPMIAGGAA